MLAMRPHALRSPKFWLWLCLAAWPPELLSRAAAWDWVDPHYVGLMLAWWPVDALGRLMAVAWLLGLDPTQQRSLGDLLRSTLAAEILVGLKASALALLGLLPALALLAYDRPKLLPLALALAVLGVIPALIYTLRRLLAPLWLLRQPLNASQALQASAQQTEGRFKLFLRLALPWLALSAALDLLSLALPNSLAVALEPISLALGLWALVQADQGLA